VRQNGPGASPRRPICSRWCCEKTDGQAVRLRQGSRGGRPPGFNEERYKKCNTIERAINRPKQSRDVATRYDKRSYVFLGTAPPRLCSSGFGIEPLPHKGIGRYARA
jgi:hypothetical protein